MSPFSPRRAALVMGVVASSLAGMVGRVAYLQSSGRQRTIQFAERQQHSTQAIQARRGNIFDRNGLVMAGTVQTLAVYCDPAFMYREYEKKPRNLNQLDKDLAKLAGVLDVEFPELENLLQQKYNARYLRLVENQGEQTAKAVAELNIPGVGVEPMHVRYYPMGSIASHVLGSCGGDGNGLEGLELKFNATLAGRNGYKKVEKDAARRTIGIDREDFVLPKHGQHVVLTIDASIQMIVEQELAQACEKFRAPRGEAIVLDPHTGEVLALANYPTFNPQNAGDSPAAVRRNNSIVVPYEPGSTLKPFIVGPALSWHATKSTEVWQIPSGAMIPYGTRRVTDVHDYGPLTTWDVLVKSSNKGMALMAARMGNAKLHQALRMFGFGGRTGIELPGEDPGLVMPLRRWTRYSTESIAQGYELMITPMQLARAFCVYANDGHLVPVRVVKGTLDENGRVVSDRPPVKLAEMPKVIDAASAREVRQILSDVVVRGTARGKGSAYWNVFGKTGTAHISRGRAGYAHNLYNSSFVGGAPVERPRVVVAVILHEADRSLGHYGGTVTAPAAVRIIERTLGYLQEPKSPPLTPPPANVANLLHNWSPKLYQTASTEE